MYRSKAVIGIFLVERQLRAGCVARTKLTPVPYTLLHKGDVGEEDLGWVNYRSTCLTTSFPVWARALRLVAARGGQKALEVQGVIA